MTMASLGTHSFDDPDRQLKRPWTDEGKRTLLAMGCAATALFYYTPDLT